MTSLFALILSIAAIIFRGYGVSVLWSWFVVYQFGANPISIPVAIGLSLIVSLTTIQIPELIAVTKLKDEKEKLSDSYKAIEPYWHSIIIFFTTAGLLLTGYVAKHFVG